MDSFISLVETNSPVLVFYFFNEIFLYISLFYLAALFLEPSAYLGQEPLVAIFWGTPCVLGDWRSCMQSRCSVIKLFLCSKFFFLPFYFWLTFFSLYVEVMTVVVFVSPLGKIFGHEEVWTKIFWRGLFSPSLPNITISLLKIITLLISVKQFHLH